MSNRKALRRLSGIGGVSDRGLSKILQVIKDNPELATEAAASSRNSVQVFRNGPFVHAAVFTAKMHAAPAPRKSPSSACAVLTASNMHEMHHVASMESTTR